MQQGQNTVPSKTAGEMVSAASSGPWFCHALVEQFLPSVPKRPIREGLFFLLFWVGCLLDEDQAMYFF
ncbi:MAG: hypothetical protein HWE25_06980 [Alphaproteobacteria bacterium]|nr:hypothetical protein [Alphaproteobacteria bacterium]